MAACREIHLLMVTVNNHNKFYNIRDNGNGQLTAEFGRVGATKQIANYASTRWEALIREKLRKGYKDVTALATETPPELCLWFEEAEVGEVMRQLIRYGEGCVQENYRVSVNAVTSAMIDEAQRLIDGFLAEATVGSEHAHLNNLLLSLYHVIPRRMQNVQKHLLSTDLSTESELGHARDLILAEQQVLDPLRAQVKLNATECSAGSERDLLSELGIIASHVEPDAAVYSEVRDLMGDDANMLRRILRVTNARTQKSFDARVAAASDQTVRLFWHGSRNENWLSIVGTGLVLRPATAHITGKMFGYGIYFASRFSKSLGYTSLKGSYWTKGTSEVAYLALYTVHIGAQLVVHEHCPWCSTLDADQLVARGVYDSLWARAGRSLRNDEFVVYEEAQTTITYLVEVSSS